MIDVQEYIDLSGRSRYGGWFGRLSPQAAAKVATGLTRLAGGNFSNVKGVGSGLFEYKVDFGPGYRIYFGKDGERFVILLGGGSKTRQHDDIGTAHTSWQEYKRRKKENPHASHT
jgi:putative addiction module killer protein